MKNGNILKFLIDTGANKNFVKPELAKTAIPTNVKFKIRSAAGDIEINKKIQGPFFKNYGLNNTIDFFVLPGLKTFDGIIGDDTLKELGAIIDRKNNILTISTNIEIPLHEKKSHQVNNIELRDNHLLLGSRQKLQEIVSSFHTLFEPVNNTETITTEVRAEIKTTTEEPIYTKSYPYPYHMRQEVEKQISQLLADGIIRPSKSPYNSPIWIVEKKKWTLHEQKSTEW